MADEPEFERPDEKVLTVWLVSNLLTYGILALVILAIATILAIVDKAYPWLFAAGLAPIALCGLTAIFLRRTWERWGFRLTASTLEIRHGMIWRSHRIVARKRIQHVDINSGPLDRRFGLVQVVIYTAGTTVGLIPGLTPERAETLRTGLSKTMEQPRAEEEGSETGGAAPEASAPMPQEL